MSSHARETTYPVGIQWVLTRGRPHNRWVYNEFSRAVDHIPGGYTMSSNARETTYPVGIQLVLMRGRPHTLWIYNEFSRAGDRIPCGYTISSHARETTYLVGIQWVLMHGRPHTRWVYNEFSCARDHIPGGYTMSSHARETTYLVCIQWVIMRERPHTRWVYNEFSCARDHIFSREGEHIPGGYTMSSHARETTYLVGIFWVLVLHPGELHRVVLVFHVCDSQGVFIVAEAYLPVLVSGIWSMVYHTLGVVGVAVLIKAANLWRVRWVTHVNHVKTAWKKRSWLYSFKNKMCLILNWCVYSYGTNCSMQIQTQLTVFKQSSYRV